MDTYEIQESITVVFDSEDAADDFLGLLVTDVKKKAEVVRVSSCKRFGEFTNEKGNKTKSFCFYH